MTRPNFPFLLNCLFTSRAISRPFLTSLDFEFLKAGFRTCINWALTARKNPLGLYVISRSRSDRSDRSDRPM